MAAFRDQGLHKQFPLRSIQDVVRFFRHYLSTEREPDLTLLSIITGMIESRLTKKYAAIVQQHHPPPPQQVSSTTTTKTTTTAIAAAAATTKKGAVVGRQDDNDNKDHTDDDVPAATSFPTVELDEVELLYKKFQTILRTVQDVKPTTKSRASFATREIIKKVSDVIWNSLIRSSYKDRDHLQSLYSYLALNKLDCFGVAFSVVAGCQLLGFGDVHLAVSEDHAWVVFGKEGTDTIEVTWHGKGSEDKRGQPVQPGYESHSWLYLSGNPVICDRYMETSAIVASINPSLNMSSTCSEVAEMQQHLLWLLYDLKHLAKYPMAIGCLSELEEVARTPKRPSCDELYMEAIKTSRRYYKNHHVYPYTYQGAFYYRQMNYREAFASWANAGDVIRLYNYSRDDEEIYKEFLDIANEMIPLVMKTESSGHSGKSILRDPQCFANLLRFYDGICQWEEGSLTPILHIGWAKPLVNTISKFDYDIRSQVIINCAKDDDDGSQMVIGIVITDEHKDNENNNNNSITKACTIRKHTNSCDEKKDEAVISTLEALTAACGEKILNPDFLLQGGGQPFADQNTKKDHRTEQEKADEAVKKEASIQEIVKELISETNAVAAAEKIGGGAPNVIQFQQNDCLDLEPKRPVITLYSQKMKGLKDLLLNEKLNTHAISLQVTAQSQVQVHGKKGRLSAHGYGSEFDTRPKRSRQGSFISVLMHHCNEHHNHQ